VVSLFAILTLIGVVVYSGYRHATTSLYFAFDEINITGAKRLAEKEILSAAGLRLGVNIFSIDTALAQEGLLEHPWVAEASVKRKLPGRLDISLTERRAVAVVNLDVLYLLDDAGEVFKRWVRGDPIPSPIITGVTREAFLDDPESVEEIFQSALSLASRYREGGLDKLAPISEIHFEHAGGFSLTIGEDPMYVRFGKGPYRTKLKRLAVLMRRLAREGRRPAVIFFDNDIRPDRITVKMKRAEEPEVEGGKLFSKEDKKSLSKI
jgi:cell division protein FtsQ